MTVRNAMKHRAGLAALVFVLAGCGVLPVNGPRLSQEQPAPPDKATVFLYNPSSHVGGLACPRFAVGNRASAPLPNGSYARFDLAPGTYRIKPQTSWCFAVPVSGAVIVGAGETVFIKLDRAHAYTPGYTRTPGTQGGWLGLEEVPAVVGRREMADLGRTNGE